MKSIVLSFMLLLCAASGIRAQQLGVAVEETTHGEAWTVTFTLSEVTDFTALSLQLSLPEQLRAVDISAGAEIASTHQVLMGEVGTGVWNVIHYSQLSALFAQVGATFSIRLQSSEKLGNSRHTLSLSDIRLADVQGVETKMNSQSVELLSTEAPDVMGDVNGDGAFSAADVVTLLNALVGLPNATYYAERADMDANGEVSIGDVVILCNKIMEQPASVRPQADLAVATMQVRATDTTLPTHGEGIARLEIEVDENNYSALQMNIALPQGVQLVDVVLPSALKDMEVRTRLLEDGNYRLMLYANGGILLPESPVDLELHLTTGDAVQGDIQIFAATASTDQGKEERLGEHSAGLTVQNAPTGIGQLSTDGDKNGAIYDLSGRRVKQPVKGVFIRNGKKYIR